MCDQQPNTTENQTEQQHRGALPHAPETRNGMGVITKQISEAIRKTCGFFCLAQIQVLAELCEGEERQFFYNKFVELAEIITTMPVTYETDGQGMQATAFLHYFTGCADWYITELDMEAVQLQAFGLANLGYGGELGYISIVEILKCGGELDLHWTPKKLSEI